MDKYWENANYSKARFKRPPTLALKMNSVFGLGRNKYSISSSEVQSLETKNEEIVNNAESPEGIDETDAQKIIFLEKELQETQEKYSSDMKNMQDYINLLRKRVTSNQSGTFCNEEEIRKEKEKTLVFYKALKAKERECSEMHIHSSNSSLHKKIQLLLLDKNKLENALHEAEKDMKRLYQEIKYQNEIIASYKDKISSDQVIILTKRCEGLEKNIENEKEASFLLQKENKKSEETIKEQAKKI